MSNQKEPTTKPIGEVTEELPIAATPKQPTDIAPVRNLRLEGLAIGRIIRAVVRAAYGAGQAPVTRAALIVNVQDFDSGLCNLQIFTDGANDRALDNGREQNLIWGVGYTFDFDKTRAPGTWHWPS